MHNSSNKLKQQKGKPKMDGLARPGASKGVSKRSHFQKSSGQGTSEPGGQVTCGPGSLSTHRPGRESTHESGGQCIREPSGLARTGASKGVSRRSHVQNSSTSWTGEPGGQGTGEPGGLSTRWPGRESTRNSGEQCIREPGGLARTGASKGVSKRSHFQNSSISWIGEPGGQGTGEPGQGTCGPGGLRTLESGGPCIREPRGQSCNWLQNEENSNSFSSCQSPVIVMNHGEEDERDDDHETDYAQTETDTSDDELEENMGSTSHGKTNTRKETRALGETRKSRLNKRNLVFEVDDCSGRIVGDDSQTFITKGGCVMRKFAKLDGTTWKKQSDLLKRDIITKSVENSNYDETCDKMEIAMQKQLASQHKNKQYKLHLHFKKYPSKEEAMVHPPAGVKTRDWVNLCERFASEEFQKISARNKINRSFNKVPPAVGSLSVARRVDKKKRKGKVVTAIGMYEMAHYSKKTHKMVNEEAEKVLNELRIEEASSTLTPAEICLKQLKHIPGHIKGRSASTKNILGNEKLRLDLESEKERAQALEENMKVMNKKQRRLQKQNKKFKGQLKFMMKEIARLSRLQSETHGGT